MDRPVFITGLGRFLPGEPIGNDQIEDVLGKIGGRASRARRRILAQNGIQTRHYALDDAQRPLLRNSELAAAAARDAVARSPVTLEDIDYLASATTLPDLFVPGFASMVHGELGNPPCEIASYGGVCASGIMALKGAWLQVRAGEREAAVVCASELASRHLKSSRFEDQPGVLDGEKLPFEAEFLRWMLSDGAGAAVLQPRPAPRGVSLRVEWIEVRSFADRFPPCMYAGARKGDDGQLGPSWGDHASFAQAARDGLFDLRQDVRLLEQVVALGVDGFLDLVERERFVPGELDWLLCHYSSDVFRGRIVDLLARSGVHIPAEKWFTNLPTVGNVGAASIYLMLEQLVREGRVTPGQQLLLVVPESGRFVTCYALLTAVGPEGAAGAGAPAPAPAPIAVAEPQAPNLPVGGSARAQELTRRLTRCWIDFETGLRKVPIVQKLERGQLGASDYKLLLVNLRQQVMEGARWISRAASSMTIERFALRSLLLRHAWDEHRDYQMLERDYVAMGGSLAELAATPKNIGSEAFSAWMFHRAGQEDPLDLLGAMFIIEGLGARVAGRWGKLIKAQLGLRDDQVSFLLHHAGADEDHLGRLESVLGPDLLTDELVDRIVKTARVTARLYRLQLEELGNV